MNSSCRRREEIGSTAPRPNCARGSAALERLNARLSIGNATTKPEEIVKAARYARVETMFLGGDEHLWGVFGEVKDRVVTHGRATERDVDLLDYAALITLRHRDLSLPSTERDCRRQGCPRRSCDIERYAQINVRQQLTTPDRMHI